MDYDSQGKSYYDGDLQKSVRHGWGVRQYPSANLYKGMWFNNVRHGQGTMKWVDRNQIYTGQWENGIQVSWLCVWRRGGGGRRGGHNHIYTGQWENGIRGSLGVGVCVCRGAICTRACG